MPDGEFNNLAVTGKLFIGSWGSVAQDTSITTAVTLDTARGQITTQDPALGAGAETAFTLTNAAIHADSVVVLSIVSGPADNEHVWVHVTALAEGSCQICLTNLAAANQADGAMVINFVVI